MRHEDRRQRAAAREAEGRDAPGLAGGPAVGRPRIVCLGDSTTLGWPRTLRDLVGDAGEVVNAAFGAATLAQILARMDDAVRGPGVRDVCVLAGINDIMAGASAAAIKADLREVYTRIEGQGGNPLPVTILPFGGRQAWTPATEATRAEVNSWISGLPYRHTDAEAMGDGDAARPALRQEYSGDGLHPNRLGHYVLATMIYAQSIEGAGPPQA